MEAQNTEKLPAVQTMAEPEEKISEVDKMALELAKQKKLTALAEAKTALAQNDLAELAFKHVVMQIYRKYSLADTDALDAESGKIMRGGNAMPPTPSPVVSTK